MKKLTKKQILIVNNEIRKTALKMRNNSNNPCKWAYMLKMLKNNKLTSRGFWTILGGMIIVTFVIESFIEFIFNLIDF